MSIRDDSTEERNVSAFRIVKVPAVVEPVGTEIASSPVGSLAESMGLVWHSSPCAEVEYAFASTPIRSSIDSQLARSPFEAIPPLVGPVVLSACHVHASPAKKAKRHQTSSKNDLLRDLNKCICWICFDEGRRYERTLRVTEAHHMLQAEQNIRCMVQGCTESWGFARRGDYYRHLRQRHKLAVRVPRGPSPVHEYFVHARFPRPQPSHWHVGPVSPVVRTLNFSS